MVGPGVATLEIAPIVPPSPPPQTAPEWSQPVAGLELQAENYSHRNGEAVPPEQDGWYFAYHWTYRGILQSVRGRMKLPTGQNAPLYRGMRFWGPIPKMPWESLLNRSRLRG